MLVQHLPTDERRFSPRDLICDGFTPTNSCHKCCHQVRQVQASHICPSVLSQSELFANPSRREPLVTDAPWGGLCACLQCTGVPSGRAPDQMLVLSVAAAPCINNPRSLYFMTFISQPCQASSGQIQTYPLHTSATDKCPRVF